MPLGSLLLRDGPGNQSSLSHLTWPSPVFYAARETGGLAVAPCQVEEDVDYVGPELQSLQVSSLSDCLAACLSNPVCRAVSLAANNCSLKYSIQHRLGPSLPSLPTD